MNIYEQVLICCSVTQIYFLEIYLTTITRPYTKLSVLFQCFSTCLCTLSLCLYLLAHRTLSYSYYAILLLSALLHILHYPPLKRESPRSQDYPNCNLRNGLVRGVRALIFVGAPSYSSQLRDVPSIILVVSFQSHCFRPRMGVFLL